MPIKNIFDEDKFKHSNEIKTFQKYHETFRLFLQIELLLNTRYLSQSDIEDVSDDCVANFVNGNNFESFDELFTKVDIIEIKNIDWQKNQKIHLYKLITFVYSHLMKFPDNKTNTK